MFLFRVRAAQTVEKLQDEYQFFILYYGSDIQKMKLSLKTARRKQKEQQRLEESQGIDEEPADEEPEILSLMKHATRNSSYRMCIASGLSKIPHTSSMQHLQCSCAVDCIYTVVKKKLDPYYVYA